jgi:hypothetical protein
MKRLSAARCHPPLDEDEGDSEVGKFRIAV